MDLTHFSLLHLLLIREHVFDVGSHSKQKLTTVASAGGVGRKVWLAACITSSCQSYSSEPQRESRI